MTRLWQYEKWCPRQGRSKDSHTSEILQGEKLPSYRLISFCLFHYRSGGQIAASQRNFP
jgi:hypothetical protein